MSDRATCPRCGYPGPTWLSELHETFHLIIDADVGEMTLTQAACPSSVAAIESHEMEEEK